LIRASALLSSQFRSTFYGRNAGQLSIPDEKPGLDHCLIDALKLGEDGSLSGRAWEFVDHLAGQFKRHSGRGVQAFCG